MKRPHFYTLLCGAAAAAMLAGCSGTADYSNSTLTGQVTDIAGTTVTLQLGELSESTIVGSPAGESEEASGGEAAAGETTGAAAGETASSGSESSDGQTPPEKPQGEDGQTPSETPQGESSDEQTPPEKPQGERSDGQTPPEASGEENGQGGMGPQFVAGEETASIDLDGATVTLEEGAESAEGSLEDIKTGDVLVIEVGDNNTVTSVTVKAVNQGGFGGSGQVTQGTAANELTEDGTYTGESYASTGDDENALRVTGAAVTLDGITVDKSAGASSNTEDGDFYGMNAALLATDGAQVTIQNADIKSSAQNGNGVFSYGEGTTVNISDSAITTTADNSGGIQTTGGGTTNASNLTVETSGNSSAAIRSDRGGGTVNVDGGTYTSNGYNSPAVYSTADITVANAVLTANHSEALVIEGQNAIALENCTVSGNMSDTQGSSSDINVHNVMIYQSMSGDAQVGTSSFSMTGGSLTGKNGDLFYVTNTHCVLTLSGVTLKNEDSEGNLLTVSGNDASHGWGTAGSNGAQVEFTADGQALEGNIVVDSISTLTLTLKNGSSLVGTINIADNAEGGQAVENNAVVTIDSGCVWTLTDDCTVTSLTNNGTINYNGHTITLADGTVLGE